MADLYANSGTVATSATSRSTPKIWRADKSLSPLQIHSLERAEPLVRAWLGRFQDGFLANAPGAYYQAKNPSNPTGAEARRQMDFLVKPKRA